MLLAHVLAPEGSPVLENRSAIAPRFSVTEDLLSIPKRDLAERLDGHLAVNLR